MIKKFAFNNKLAMVLLLLSTLCGCGSGGGNGPSSAPPNPNTNSAPSVNTIAPPSGFIPDGSHSAIYVNTNTRQIAVPSINGYQIISISEELATEIAANHSAARSFLQHNILFQLTYKNIYWIDINGISGKISTKSFNGTAIPGSGLGNADTYPLSVGNTTVISIGNSYVTYSAVNSADNGTIQYSTPNASSGSFSISSSDLAGVCNVSDQKITAVQTAIFNGVVFLGIGTANGTVCIDNVDVSTGLPIPNNWQNLSAKAAKKVGPGSYSPNPITGFGFYYVGNNMLSYWSLTAPSTGIISTYRVTGTFNGSNAGVPSNYLPAGFINLGVSQPQALLNGTPSVQINYIPSAMSTNPAISMVNREGYLCTVIGTGYNNTKLQVYDFITTGSTNWSNPTTFLSGNNGFGNVFLKYGVNDQCIIFTSNGTTYSIEPNK